MQNFEQVPSQKTVETKTGTMEQEKKRRMEIEVEVAEQKKKEEKLNKTAEKTVPEWLEDILDKAFRTATTVEEEKEEAEKKITLAERDIRKEVTESLAQGDLNIAPIFEKREIGPLDKESYERVFDDISIREAAAEAVSKAIRGGTTSFDNYFEFNKFVLPNILEDIDVQDAVYEQMNDYAKKGDFYRFEELTRKFAEPKTYSPEEINEALKEGVIVKLADSTFVNTVENYRHVIPEAIFHDIDVQKRGKEIIARLSRDEKNTEYIRKLKDVLNIT